MAAAAVAEFQRMLAHGFAATLSEWSAASHDYPATLAATKALREHHSAQAVRAIYKEERAYMGVLTLLLHARKDGPHERLALLKPGSVLARRIPRASCHSRTSLLRRYVARAILREREMARRELAACRVLCGAASMA